jgi:hypothetical protein
MKRLFILKEKTKLGHTVFNFYLAVGGQKSSKIENKLQTKKKF